MKEESLYSFKCSIFAVFLIIILFEKSASLEKNKSFTTVFPYKFIFRDFCVTICILFKLDSIIKSSFIF